MVSSTVAYGFMAAFTGLLVLVSVLGFMALALVYPSGIGGGDVKLAGVIGLILGWPAILWAVGVALVICGITGVAISMSHNPKRTVAFGPFLAGGAVVGFLV